MIRRCAFWTAAMLAVLTTASAWAAEDVFHAIPSDALAFAAVNRIGETSATVQKLAKQVGAPPVGLLDLCKAFTGAKKGIDETRGAAFVVAPGKDPKGEPTPVFLIPVTDYKQFLESWNAKPTDKIVEVTIAGGTALIGQRGSYAAMSPNRSGNTDFHPGLEKLLAAKRSIADEYPQLLPWLTENNAVEVATSRGIKLASEAVQKQLKQLKEMFARMGADLPPPIAALEVYAKVLQWAEKEIDVVGIAARADKDGAVRVTVRTRFLKGSNLFASLAKVQPLEKGSLAGIPAGPFVIAGGGPWSDALTHAMIAMQADFMKNNFRTAYGMDEKQADRFAKALLDTPKGVRSLSMAMGPGQPGEPVLGDMIALYGVDNAAKYLEEYEKYLLAMSESVKNAEGTNLKKPFSVKKTEIGGRPALESEMTIPVPPKAAGLPGFDEKMAKLLGPGGKLKTLMVAVDEHTVALSFTGRTSLVMRAIAAMKKPADGLAADPDVTKAAAALPAGGQWVGYFSPSGAVAFAKWIVDAMSDEGGFKPNIPDFPACPPIGVAAKALPGELQIDAVVSPAVLEAIGKYVGLVQSAEHPEVP